MFRDSVQVSAAFFIWSNERCVLAEGHTSLKGGRSEFVFLRRSHSVGCDVCDCIGFLFNSFLQVAILPLLATESNAPSQMRGLQNVTVLFSCVTSGWRPHDASVIQQYF